MFKEVHMPMTMEKLEMKLYHKKHGFPFINFYYHPIPLSQVVMDDI